MKHETFVKGMSLLSEAFPGREMNVKLYFEVLSDLKDHHFEKAVLEIVKTTTELYPGTNLIAIIRSKCQDFKDFEDQEKNRHLAGIRYLPPNEYEAIQNLKSRKDLE